MLTFCQKVGIAQDIFSVASGAAARMAAWTAPAARHLRRLLGNVLINGFRHLSSWPSFTFRAPRLFARPLPALGQAQVAKRASPR
jgi:hypothetical protein